MTRSLRRYWVLVGCFALLVYPTLVAAQSANPDAGVPRTTWGPPDLQGLWATGFLTRLERPSDVEDLVVGPEQARTVAATLIRLIADNVDPHIPWDGVNQLAVVHGEYRGRRSF